MNIQPVDMDSEEVIQEVALLLQYRNSYVYNPKIKALATLALAFNKPEKCVPEVNAIAERVFSEEFTSIEAISWIVLLIDESMQITYTSYPWYEDVVEAYGEVVRRSRSTKIEVPNV